jgi:hypothetical protein
VADASPLLCALCCADDEPFAFEAALQSHLALGRIEEAAARGLLGKLALDCDADPDTPQLVESDEDATLFGGAHALYCQGVRCLLFN